MHEESHRWANEVRTVVDAMYILDEMHPKLDNDDSAIRFTVQLLLDATGEPVDWHNLSVPAEVQKLQENTQQA